MESDEVASVSVFKTGARDKRAKNTSTADLMTLDPKVNETCANCKKERYLRDSLLNGMDCS